MRKEKIIQFGEGGFLRGFADWMFQIVNENSDFDGSVVVVQPIEKGMCDLLEKQDCKYTHLLRDAKHNEAKKIDVISRCVNPYTDFDSFLELAKGDDIKFVVSNTTEAGITYNPDDKLDDKPQKSFPGKVTKLLFERFNAKKPGLIFLPCELIEKNGSKLKEIVLQYADLWNLGDEFKAYVENDNTFTNTLVDRINTGFPRDEYDSLGIDDQLLNTSEYFHLWVVEGCPDLFDYIPFDKAGLNVVLTDDLPKYRTRKVRILNGAHTSLVPFALLKGYDTVKSCIDSEETLTHIKKCVFDEIIPTLDLPEDELTEYANNVLERFANPYIKHMLSSIALNSVSKFKVRVLPSILEYIKRYNKTPDTLVFSFAMLIAFYKTDMTNDGEDVMKFMKAASVSEILAKEEYWDADLSFLKDEVLKYITEEGTVK